MTAIDFREAASRATDAIRVLEIQLLDEGCLVECEVDSKDLALYWRRWQGKWRVVGRSPTRTAPLLEWPVAARIAAYPALAALADKARESMRESLESAGLIPPDAR